MAHSPIINHFFVRVPSPSRDPSKGIQVFLYNSRLKVHRRLSRCPRRCPCVYLQYAETNYKTDPYARIKDKLVVNSDDLKLWKQKFDPDADHAPPKKYKDGLDIYQFNLSPAKTRVWCCMANNRHLLVWDPTKRGEEDGRWKVYDDGGRLGVARELYEVQKQANNPGGLTISKCRWGLERLGSGEESINITGKTLEGGRGNIPIIIITTPENEDFVPIAPKEY